MTKYFIVFLLAVPSFSFGQLYTDASGTLPDNGAKGSSMDIRTADLDNDGDLDIVLANEFQANTILINNGEGQFENTTLGNLPQSIHDSEDVAIADYNNDGNLDLIFCSEDDVVQGWLNVHEYYLGDGTGKFTIANYQFPDSEANAVMTADINGDNLPDVLFGNNGGTGVFINNGDGTFTQENNRVPQVNRTTQDLTMADVDGDGDLDLFEGNENGNLLFINGGDGFFTDETASRLPQGLNIETRKATFKDVDGDNDLDLFLSNVEFIPGKDRQNRLYINNGSGIFSDVTSSQLPTDNDHTVDAIFEDVDLDADLDLIICNFGGAPIRVYKNDGLGNYSDASVETFGQLFYRSALGVVADDLNGDGLHDIYICDRYHPTQNSKDLLLQRNSIISSIDPASFEDEDIIVMPNPGNDLFTVRTKNKIPELVLIFNTDGHLIRRINKIAESEITVDLSNAARGSYILIAKYKNGKQVAKKFIKE